MGRIKRPRHPNHKPPPEHTRFKKGNKANPLGGGAHHPVSKALRNLTVDTYREVIEVVLKGRISDLRAMIEDPETPGVQVGVATSFMKAIKEGNYEVIERIAERIVGKIPDEINLVSKNLNANVSLPTESAVTIEEIGAAYEQFDREV